MDNIVNGYYLFYHCAVYQYHDDEGNVYKDYHKQQINGCVKAGHSRQYCELHLSK